MIDLILLLFSVDVFTEEREQPKITLFVKKNIDIRVAVTLAGHTYAQIWSSMRPIVALSTCLKQTKITEIFTPHSINSDTNVILLWEKKYNIFILQDQKQSYIRSKDPKTPLEIN